MIVVSFLLLSALVDLVVDASPDIRSPQKEVVEADARSAYAFPARSPVSVPGGEHIRSMSRILGPFVSKRHQDRLADHMIKAA